MDNDKDDLIDINPVEGYETPELPSLEAAKGDTSLLERLPKRWRRNAKVVACVGVVALGLVHLANGPSISQGRLSFSTHNGGAGSGPMYVVHLTEQEAFGIIRARLEEAGLNFGAGSDYGVGIGERRFDLFDEERGVAIMNVQSRESMIMAWDSVVARELTVQLAEMRWMMLGLVCSTTISIVRGEV